MLDAVQLDRYADVLLWGLKTARRGRLQKNETIMIRYDFPALELAEKLFEKILLLGRNPVIRLLQTSTMEKRFYELAKNRQLDFIPPGEEELYRKINGSIVLLAPQSITHLSHINPSTIARSLKARKFLRDILDRREEEGLFSWTLAMYPTEALAGHAGMEPHQYAEQIARACFLNREDPVSQWETVFRKARTIKKRLNALDARKFQIESDHINLVITPGENRRWIGISGHNIPSFELFLSPDWRGTSGVFYADQPTYRSGNLVRGIRVEFIKGKVVNATAEAGQDFLSKQLKMDGGANKVGEFSLTDKTFSRISRFMANTLYDENYGGEYGNCHIALGASYSDTYAGNPADLTPALKKQLGFNDSALHWDIVNTENKRVTAHLARGKKVVIYEDGQFIF